MPGVHFHGIVGQADWYLRPAQQRGIGGDRHLRVLSRVRMKLPWSWMCEHSMFRKHWGEVGESLMTWFDWIHIMEGGNQVSRVVLTFTDSMWSHSTDDEVSDNFSKWILWVQDLYTFSVWLLVKSTYTGAQMSKAASWFWNSAFTKRTCNIRCCCLII